MKQILIIFATFALAMLTTTLFDLPFIKTNLVRYIIVLLFIIIEFILGFYILKTISKQ